MRVKELIEKLQKVEWNPIVLVDWYEEGYDDFEQLKEMVVVKDNVDAHWEKNTSRAWSYSWCDSKEFDKLKKQKAILLSTCN